MQLDGEVIQSGKKRRHGRFAHGVEVARAINPLGFLFQFAPRAKNGEGLGGVQGENVTRPRAAALSARFQLDHDITIYGSRSKIKHNIMMLGAKCLFCAFAA